MAITKNDCKKIRDEVTAALAVLERAGYTARVMPRASYDSCKMVLKIEVSQQGVDTAANDFALCARLFGFKAEDYGKTSTVGSLGEVRLVELKPASPKYPIVVERISDGKRYKLTEAQYSA